jgi:hypothetical protein
MSDICFKCNKEIVPDPRYAHFTPGYGIDKDNNKFCYSCIGEMEKEEITNTPIGSKHLFYYTEEKTGERTFKTFVINWPSSVKYSCYTKQGRHNFGLKMLSIWFKDHNGNNWYGRIVNPDYNQSFMAKRIKG